MAWENSMKNKKLEILEAYLSQEETMTSICRSNGVSRKTVYEWLHKFLEEGEEGLEDHSRAPHKAYRLYDDIKIEKAIDIKLRHKRWGPKKIKIKLEDRYPEEKWPSATRLYEIFKEHNLVNKRRFRNRVPATSPLGDLSGCNDTWAVDLKGWFLTGDGHKCEPLTITDCYARYLIKCTHLKKHSVEYTWPIFDEAFREFGLPIRVRSDNGPPFGSCGAGRLTRLSINLIKAGVTPEWTRPGHPEENGRHERFHLTLKQETATPPAETLAIQIQRMSQFYEEYNYERPHEALNMQVPGSIYKPSSRTWDGILRSPEYDAGIEVRKVDKGGIIKWKGLCFFISETLYGEYVGLIPQEKDEEKEDYLECYYGPIYLGRISESKGFEKPKIEERRQR